MKLFQTLRLTGFLYLLGMLLLLLGERMFGDGSTQHLLFSGLGGACLLGVLALSARDASLSAAHRLHLIFALVGVASVGVYLLGTDLVLDSLSLSADGEHTAEVVLGALWPIVWLSGTLPLLALDWLLGSSPIKPVAGRGRYLAMAWLSAAFALAMLFPINYIGTDTNKRWDLGYFKTAQPGTATVSLIDSLEVPVTAYLFFPPSAEVTSEIHTYFDELEGGNLAIEYVDHALEPELAKELKVRNNGYVVLVRGEGDEQQVERIKVGEDFDSARRNLKKLDAEVFKSMMKVARGPRVAYITVGHGELYWKTDTPIDRRINDLKKQLRQANFNVKELGLIDGLATEVPEDATVVLILGPQEAFLEEEIETLNTWRRQGGAMLIALEPGGPDLSGLLAPVGVAYDPKVVLASDSNYVPIFRGPVDRMNLVTNKFSTHESVTTLSRNSARAGVITPSAVLMEKLDTDEGKATVTIRTLDSAWADYNLNLKLDETAPPPQPAVEGEEPPPEPRAEKRDEWPLAIATSGDGEEGEFRVIVTADATWLSDFVMEKIPVGNNGELLRDSLAWLVDDTASTGTISDEKDVKIQHTKEGQGWIFYSTAFLLPLAFLIAGMFRVQLRRKRS